MKKMWPSLFFSFLFSTEMVLAASPFLQDPLSARLKSIRQEQTRKQLTVSQKVDLQVPAIFKDQKAVTQCIQETCGPASQNHGAYDMNEPWKKETTASRRQWDMDLRPLLEAVTATEVDVQRASVERLKYLTSSANSSKIDRQTLHMIIIYSQLLNEAAELSAKTMLVQNTTGLPSVTIRDSELERLLADRSPEEKLVLQQILRVSIAPMVQLSIALDSPEFPNDLMAHLKIHYGDKISLRAAQMSDASTLLQQLQRLEKVIGAFMPYSLATTIDIALLNKAKEGHDLNQMESERYVEFAQKVGAYILLLKTSIRTSLLKIPFDFTTAVQQMADQLKQIPLSSLNQDPKTLAQQIQESCSQPLRLSQAMLPSKLKLAQTQKLLIDLKKSAASVAAQYSVSPSSAEEMARSTRLDFILPEATSTDIDKLRNILLDRLDRAKRLSADLQQNKASADTLIFLNAYLTDEMTSLIDMDPSEDDGVIFCSQLEEQTVSDLTVSSLGQIYLSRFAVLYPRQGIGIIAHEMGHVFAETLRSQGQGYVSTPFQESNQCISKRNPFSQGGSISQWEEEDWADFFSSRVLQEFRRSKSPWATAPNNFACSVVVDTGFLYGRNLITPRQESAHSAAFLRLLNIQNDLGQHVGACQVFQEALTQWSGQSRQCQ